MKDTVSGSSLLWASLSTNPSLYVHCMLIKMDHLYVDNGHNLKWKPSGNSIRTLHFAAFTSIQSSSISVPQPLEIVYSETSVPPGDGFPRKLLILNIVQFRCKKALAVWGPAPFAVISIQHRQNSAVCALNKTRASRLECVRGTGSLLLEIWSLQNKMWQLSGDARWNCGVMIKIFQKP